MDTPQKKETKSEFIIRTDAEFKFLSKKNLKIFKEEPALFIHPDSILNKKDNFKVNEKFKKDIVNWIKKDKLDESITYHLFVDFSLFQSQEKNILAISGWLTDHDKNPILEYIREIPITNSKQLNRIELFTVEEGLNLLNELGINKFNLYTKVGNVPRLLLMKQKALKEAPHLTSYRNTDDYTKLLNSIKNKEATIHYYPKEFNNHANNLAKLYYNEYKEEVSTELNNVLLSSDYMLQDIEKAQFFSHKKIKTREILENEVILVSRYSTTDKSFHNFLINTTTLSIDEFSIKNIDYLKGVIESYDFTEKEIHMKFSNNDILAVYNTMNVLDELKNDYPNLVLAYPSKGMQAIVKNLTKIKDDYLEEYMQLHEMLNEFEDVTFIELPQNIEQKIRNHFNSNNINIKTHTIKK